MIKKTFSGIDVDVYYEKLKNGLEVFLVPYDNRKNYYMEYGVKYGANICEFISFKNDEKIKPPKGVAHFLEHKMFEQEDGNDPFSFFSLSGSDANAFTSYDITAYTVEGIKSIEENLDYLLNYVNSPYFTDKNVEKEKGIIIEELNMYKDQPENILYEESNKALLVKHPMRYDIGGTPSSVKKITKEILYECYDTFYQPNNMFLIVSGKFDVKRIEKVIKNNKLLNSKYNNKKVEVFNVKEPVKVKEKEKELKIDNLIIPKSILNIKSPIKDMNNEEKYKYELALNILLYILFGMSSEFREKIFNQKKCSLFYSSCSLLDNLSIIEFLLESKKPYELKNMIIDCLKSKKITNEDVERVKKVKISLEVMDSDKPHKMLNVIAKDIIDYDEVMYNKREMMKSVTLEDVEKVREDLLLDNYSFVVGMPK